MLCGVLSLSGRQGLQSSQHSFRLQAEEHACCVGREACRPMIGCSMISAGPVFPSDREHVSPAVLLPCCKTACFAVTPALASAVRPPASSLPPAPPPIRLQPRAQQSPMGSPAGFGPASTAPAAAPGTLYAAAGSAAGASPSPTASARYGVAQGPGEVSDSEDGHSPVKRQELYNIFTYHAAAQGGVGGSGSGSGVVRPGGGSSGGGYVRAPSPLGTEAAREAIAKAAASGSFSPMSAALHAKQQLLGSPGGSAGGGGHSVSPGSSPVKQLQQQQVAGPAAGVVRLSPTGVTAPAAAAAAAVQQQQQQQQVSAAAALATKQYLGVTSFEDSDEF